MERTEHLDYLDVIEAESAALLDAARTAGLDAPVPSCPDWTVADLLGHIGRVQRWQADLVRRRVAEAEWSFEDPPVDPDALVDWATDAAALVREVFAATPAATPMWTFLGPGAAGFWFRRQAHEVAMHRVDADLAAGRPPRIDAGLARDGIDEFVGVVVEGRLRERFVGAGETVHLHCTDGAGEWLIRLTPDGPEVERAHAKGDVAARGGASDLLLLLRGRTGVDAIEVFGDRAVLESFIDLSRL